jgi:hypothetical protein
MSLTSRVTNFISGNPSAQREERDKLGLADDGLPGGGGNTADVRLGMEGFKSKSMASKEDEDEGRPAYIHVRNAFIQFLLAEDKLICTIVDDCRRARRYHWRFTDALS